MKLVETLNARGPTSVLDAHVSYHLNAGVDLILATVRGTQAEAREMLRSFERAGYVRVLDAEGEARESDWRTRMARLAATEHGADWVLNAELDEFWWPRGESLKEVLAPIPPRYTVVQGLRRTFVPERGGAEFFAERMTMRRSLDDSDNQGERMTDLLRPVHRVDPGAVARADGSVLVRRFVPLRAWYPIEVLHFPEVDVEDVAPPRTGVSLVRDTRLRDALHVLREPASDDAPGAFALPAPGLLSFPTPDIVDDAAYAVECAAVGEVDLPRLEQYIAELEQRIGWLEQRFWPRVLRAGSRLVQRVRT